MLYEGRFDIHTEETCRGREKGHEGGGRQRHSAVPGTDRGKKPPLFDNKHTATARRGGSGGKLKEKKKGTKPSSRGCGGADHLIIEGGKVDGPMERNRFGQTRARR